MVCKDSGLPAGWYLQTSWLVNNGHEMAQDPPDMESVHSHFTLVTVALTQEEAASTEKAICTKKEKEGPNDLGKATPAASGRKSLTSATGRTVAVWLHVSRVLFFWQTQRLFSGCRQTWLRMQYEMACSSVTWSFG